MSENDTDGIVERLVTEFEATKLAAIDARERYLMLMLTSDEHVNFGAAFVAQRSWIRLEAACDAILHYIDQLSERNAA
jgi:hypothetical protein